MISKIVEALSYTLGDIGACHVTRADYHSVPLNMLVACSLRALSICMQPSQVENGLQGTQTYRGHRNCPC